MEFKYEELLEKQEDELRLVLERLHHYRRDDEDFIRQRAAESVEEYKRVVIFFGEEIAQSYSMGVLLDGLFYQD